MATEKSIKQKVLIIDDEHLIRRSLSRAFEMAEFEVRSAENGADGLVLWAEWKPTLVLLDIIMPGMSGFEVLKKRPAGQTKVILISAYSGDAKLNSPRDYGADLFIPKPFEDIFQVVKSAQSLL